MKENKLVLTESVILRNRFGFILNSSYNPKNNNELFFNILKEMVHLYKNGYNTKLIKENVDNVFDVYSKVSGLNNSRVSEMFKQSGIRFILKNLEIDGDELMKEYIEIALDNTPLNEIPKLFTNCSYLTRKICDAIPSYYLNKLEMEEKNGSKFQINVTSTLNEIIRDSDFADKLEPKILKIVCPLIDKMNEKFESKVIDIRTKLLGSE
jgi:hypothetical protein